MANNANLGLASFGKTLQEKAGDFFGVGPLDNPVGELVVAATAETLATVDFSIIFELTDLINHNKAAAQPCADAVRRRLKSESRKTISLTLTLCDVCVKNCGAPLHAAFGEREFLQDIQQLAEGKAGYEVSSGCVRTRTAGTTPRTDIASRFWFNR